MSNLTKEGWALVPKVVEIPFEYTKIIIEGAQVIIITCCAKDGTTLWHKTVSGFVLGDTIEWYNPNAVSAVFAVVRDKHYVPFNRTAIKIGPNPGEMTFSRLNARDEVVWSRFKTGLKPGDFVVLDQMYNATIPVLIR